MNSIFLKICVLFVCFTYINCQLIVPSVPDCPPVDDPKNPILAADKNDCSGYYLCKNGFPYYKKCPLGWRWDDDWKVNNLF